MARAGSVEFVWEFVVEVAVQGCGQVVSEGGRLVLTVLISGGRFA
jgi:hypothetical protein